MPIKILSGKSTPAPITRTSSEVSSSVSGNIGLIKQQIDQKTSDYINTKNAVKILEKCSNSNGYIKLYTEIESNFSNGETVYITYTEPLPLPPGVFNLENPSTPFADYYLGYKILSVNNYRNEIVIDRYYNDTSGLTLKNQYMSKISCRGGNYFEDITDGVVFYNCDIYDMDFGVVAGVVSGSTISGATISSNGISTTSDFEGKFLFSLPVGVKELVCSATGYVTTGITVDVQKDVLSNVLIQMVTGSTPSGYVITTTPATDISQTGATSGGDVTGTGDPIIVKGLCWSLSPHPTLSNPLYVDSTGGSGTGTYTSHITFVFESPHMTVYYRAYATTSLTTFYGDELNYTT